MTTYNANRPHGFGVLNPETSTPFPKNPTLGAFFREIDRADELGSVMRKMMLYGKKYGGSDPQLIEGDVFRMIVSVPEFGDNQPEIQNIQQVAGQIMVHDVPPVEAPVELAITDKNILNTLSAEPLGRSALLKELGYSQRTGNFKKAIEKLLISGLIELTIPEKPNSRLQKYRLTGTGKHLIMMRIS